MNPDRLAELRRQRSIVRDHLAWLENEIAAATGAPPPDTPAASPPTPAPVAPAEIPATDPAVAPPDPAATTEAVRRGCIYSALVVLLFVAIALTAIYLVRYRDRPLIFMSHDEPAAPSP